MSSPHVVNCAWSPINKKSARVEFEDDAAAIFWTKFGVVRKGLSYPTEYTRDSIVAIRGARVAPIIFFFFPKDTFGYKEDTTAFLGVVLNEKEGAGYEDAAVVRLMDDVEGIVFARSRLSQQLSGLVCHSCRGPGFRGRRRGRPAQARNR
jgi:hypothetical protein